MTSPEFSMPQELEPHTSAEQENENKIEQMISAFKGSISELMMSNPVLGRATFGEAIGVPGLTEATGTLHDGLQEFANAIPQYLRDIWFHTKRAEAYQMAGLVGFLPDCEEDIELQMSLLSEAEELEWHALLGAGN